MKFEIVDKPITITLEDAIREKHIIGLVECFDMKKKYLIIRVGIDKYSIIVSKERKSKIFYSDEGFASLKEAINFKIVDKSFKITKSFDRYEDAFRWYLE